MLQNGPRARSKEKPPPSMAEFLGRPQRPEASRIEKASAAEKAAKRKVKADARAAVVDKYVNQTADRDFTVENIGFTNTFTAKKIKEMKEREEDMKRAERYVPDIPFFQNLQKSIPGFLKSAVYISQFHKLSKGDVVFRQGDRPARLYYVVSGKVGVLISGPDKPKTPPYTKAKSLEEEEEKHSSKFSLDYWLLKFGFLATDDKLRRAQEADRNNYAIFSRKFTYEQMSTNALASTYGNQVAVLGPGKCFGEMALRNDDRRNATIKCLTDCEFLAVHKEDFDVKLCDKLCFIQKAVPGFKNFEFAGDPKFHPGNMFESKLYEKGEVLLEEAAGGRPGIYIIRTGTVSFRRNVLFTLGAQRDRRTWLQMGQGETFCSIGMLGSGSVEPYSAVVTSKTCVCYTMVGDTLADFDVIPRDVLEELVQGVRDAMKPILNLSGAFTGLDALQGAKEGWAGIIHELPDQHRPMSKATVKALRFHARQGRLWGSSKKYAVAPLPDQQLPRIGPAQGWNFAQPEADAPILEDL